MNWGWPPPPRADNVWFFFLFFFRRASLSCVIWILNNTHSCRKIGSVTIMSRFRSFFKVKTIADHRTWIWENHRKTIDVNGWSEKNIQWWWSSYGKTIEKPSMAMVPWKKNITIPSLWKNDHRWSLEHRPNGPKIAEVMRQDCGGYALTLPLLGRTGRGPTKIGESYQNRVFARLSLQLPLAE